MAAWTPRASRLTTSKSFNTSESAAAHHRIPLVGLGGCCRLLDDFVRVPQAAAGAGGVGDAGVAGLVGSFCAGAAAGAALLAGPLRGGGDVRAAAEASSDSGSRPNPLDHPPRRHHPLFRAADRRHDRPVPTLLRIARRPLWFALLAHAHGADDHHDAHGSSDSPRGVVVFDARGGWQWAGVGDGGGDGGAAEEARFPVRGVCAGEWVGHGFGPNHAPTRPRRRPAPNHPRPADSGGDYRHRQQ